MNTPDLYASFVLGLLATGHCIGMCGPLVIAVPGSFGPGAMPHLLYHAGRIFTYTAVGAFMGSIGYAISKLAGLSGDQYLSFLKAIQVFISLFAAAFLGWLGAARLGIIKEPSWMSFADLSKIPLFGRALTKIQKDKQTSGALVAGLILGFLPCGLSYGAFAMALAAGNPLKGMGITMLFGLGTAPGLFLLGAGASKLAMKYRRPLDILSGLLLLAMAGLILFKAAKFIFM